MNEKKPHHHGNLKDALIEAGISLLEEGGIHALSLRKCAAIAGVSHAAPAHHFGGLDGLIAAIATRGFLSFSNYMLRERDNSDDDPASQLKAICTGYLQFAEDQPALFTLMFGTRGEIEATEEQQAIAGRAYMILSETCAPFVPDDATSSRPTEILVWSIVHGYATLRQFGQGAPNQPVSDMVFNDITQSLPSVANAFSNTEKPETSL